MSVLVVGTLAFDTIETPYGKHEKLLGGSAGYAATAASFHASSRIVGVIGEDFPQEHLEFFESRGIDLEGVSKKAGESFHWSGFYGDDMNSAETRATDLNVLTQFDGSIPDSFKDSPYVLLGNIDPELQLRVLDQLSAPKLVIADTMNFWINGARDALNKVLSRIDVLSINDGEARLLSGEHNLTRAAHAILKMGPERLIVKRGEHGATLFSNGGDIFSAAAYPTTDVKDPTGAGDSFAGGLIGYLAGHNADDTLEFRKAIVVGSTLASFVVEDFSLDRFRDLNETQLRDRIRAFTKLTEVPAFGEV